MRQEDQPNPVWQHLGLRICVQFLSHVLTSSQKDETDALKAVASLENTADFNLLRPTWDYLASRIQEILFRGCAYH